MYYLHVDSAEDHELRNSLEQHSKHEEAERLMERININRKPLPNTPYANHPPTERPPIPAKSYPSYQPALVSSGRDTQAARFAARGAHVRLNSTHKHEDPRPRRRPVGPRLLDTDLHPSQPAEIRRKPVGSPAKENQPPYQGLNGQNDYTHPQKDTSDPKTSSPTDFSPLRSDTGVSITMIRRDPSSGSQWNIGSIKIPSTDGLLTEEQEPVVVELNTPGYQKFNRLPVMSVPTSNGTLDADD